MDISSENNFSKIICLFKNISSELYLVNNHNLFLLHSSNNTKTVIINGYFDQLLFDNLLTNNSISVPQKYRISSYDFYKVIKNFTKIDKFQLKLENNMLYIQQLLSQTSIECKEVNVNLSYIPETNYTCIFSVDINIFCEILERISIIDENVNISSNKNRLFFVSFNDCMSQESSIPVKYFKYIKFNFNYNISDISLIIKLRNYILYNRVYISNDGILKISLLIEYFGNLNLYLSSISN